MRIIALVAITLLLVGCVPAEPAITPVPESSSKPLFASDADALTAATEAYRAYLAMSDRITADGGANPERIAPFVTSQQLKREKKVFDSYRTQQRSTVGSSKFADVTLEAFYGQRVSVYLCVDFSTLMMVDIAGVDITPVDTSLKVPLEVVMVKGREDSVPLIIEGSDAWSGKNFCL